MSDGCLSSRILARLSFVNGHADVWRLFDDGALLLAIADGLVAPFRTPGVTKVAGIESRGFILGAACALRLGTGFVAIRKGKGLFPGEKLTATADPDYRGLSHVLRLQRASLHEGDRVLLVDDWCETGSQALTARALVEAAGATFLGLSCIVDQAADEVRKRLGQYAWLVKPPA